MPGRYQFSLPERPTRDGWFKVGQLEVTTTAVIIALSIFSMFLYAIGGPGGVFSDLIYFGPYVRDGELWRIVTWPFANPPDDLWVLLSLVFFWMTGHRVEETLGRKPYTVLMVVITIIPAVLVTAFDLTAETGFDYGVRTLLIALIVIVALDNPNATWWFGVPLWAMAGIFVLLDTLVLLGNRRYGSLLMELFAIVIGAVTVRQYTMLADLAFIPKFAGGAAKKKTARATKRQGGSTVVAGPWPAVDSGQSVIDQRELDGLLDKISAHGIDSLSRTEKNRLNELSKKLRGR